MVITRMSSGSPSRLVHLFRCDRRIKRLVPSRGFWFGCNQLFICSRYRLTLHFRRQCLGLFRFRPRKREAIIFFLVRCYRKNTSAPSSLNNCSESQHLINLPLLPFPTAILPLPATVLTLLLPVSRPAPSSAARPSSASSPNANLALRLRGR